uniref:Calponin-homology (CH) domain-containing protein n=1 Tax=Oncorhynchus tshawytscha TaxID=74940 RepID=A0A8C8MFQ7_ONCTS
MSQLSARGGFLDFSPIKKEDSPAVSYGNKENNSSHPVLSLIQFSRAPFVTFGNVKLGSSKSSVLCIENPVEDANIEVAIDKIASTKGFSVDQTRFTIPPEERVNLTITWTPIEEGGIRELITFIANGVVKHQAILLGRADAPKRRKSFACLCFLLLIIGSQKSFGGSSVKTAKIVAVAQSKLAFIKPGQTAIPRHPMPFAAKNMFYDERWIEKQETGFTWWINYVLTPDDFKVNTEVTKVNAVSLAMGGNDKFAVNKAPTKEEMSFSTYTARRRLNRLRRSACQLFTSEPMVKAIQRLELEVEARRLLVRKDRHLWKDIGERQKVLNWLLSYNPLWLRIGLETIYGEMISLESNSDVMGLAMFILKRLLWNPDIAAEFRHAKVPNLYKDGHEGALSRFTLKKLLLLVCFLDKAKESRMIEHDPCLFCMDAEFKTTKDLLLAFSRDFLSGEGILPRHLGYMGLLVSHIQTPLDEFNFAVKNLSVDLKCGIRLVRVMELFIQDWSLSRKLRMPAISRLQKVHNVDIALQVLRARGVDLKDEHDAVIDSRDIVDGHREKTLSLLWKIIFAFQVEVLLDEDQLREEISFLKHTWTTKQRLASLRADKGVLQKTAKPRPPFKHSSSKITLLMEWVNAVCQFYHLKVKNFTVSFSDGRILCYLIHHYHPSHLPADGVSHNTTQTVECSQRGRVELNSSSSDSDISFDTWPTTQNELLENEKNNFRLVNTAVSDLGGVPAMMNPADMSNTIPNEKVVTCYLSFLCARLLDLRNETRAARIIQEAWRKYRLKKDLKLYQERTVAAGKIQVLVRQFLQRRRAVCQTAAAVRIQAAWRGYSVRNALTLRRKALLWARQVAALSKHISLVIQAQWKKYITLKNYQRVRLHVVKVQALWRMKMAVTTYRRTQWAATVIQEHVRASALAREERECYCSLRSAAIKIQRNYRRCKTRRLQRENHAATVIQTAFKKWHSDKMARLTAAALKIQSCYRMHRCLKQYMGTQRSAILIQTTFMKFVARRKFLSLKKSAIVVQQQFRAKLSQFRSRKEAAWTIQSQYRAYRAGKTIRTDYLLVKKAAVTVQAWFRGVRVRQELRQKHQAATVLQSVVRVILCRRRYVLLQRAAVVLQCRYRALVASRTQRAQYSQLKLATVKLQSAYRGSSVRRDLRTKHQAATVIQAQLRMHKVRQAYLATKVAAIIVQQHFRANRLRDLQMQWYTSVKSAAVVIQAVYRGHRARMEVARMHHSAMIIQRRFLTFRDRKRFLAVKTAVLLCQQRCRDVAMVRKDQRDYLLKLRAATALQAAFRGMKVRKQLQTECRAAILIQSHIRKHLQRAHYEMLQWAVNTVQARYRANKKMMEDRKALCIKRRAVVVLQAAFRGMLSRQRMREMRMREMHKAASVLQRSYRAHCEHRQYLSLRSSVLAIQQKYRAAVAVKQQMDHYQRMRSAAILLQAAYRGQRARKEISLQHQAATMIQAGFRKHREEVKFQAMRFAAIIIQRYFRSHIQRKQDRDQFLRLKDSAIVLQAAFRGRCVRHDVAKMKRAATVIQANFRMHKEQVKFQAMRLSAVIIQRHYRSHIQMKQDRDRFIKIRESAIVLQEAFREMTARKQLQTECRASILIQSHVRKHLQRANYKRLQWAVNTVQARYRANKKMMEDRKALCIKRAVVVLQAAFRGMLSRQRMREMHKAASILQRSYRAHCEHRQYLSLRSSVLAIQQKYRAAVAVKQQMDHYQRMRSAAILLQAAYRGQRARKEISLQHQAATMIQAGFRKHREEVKFQAMRFAAIIIQRYFRSHIQRKQDRDQFLRLKDSAIVLQAAFRGRCVRHDVAKMKRAATVIQANFRMHKEQVKFQAMRLSAVIIQRHYRAHIQMKRDRDRFIKIRESAIVLQAAFRAYHIRQDAAKMHRAASVIQANFRMHKEQVKFQAMRFAATIIQRYFRCYIQMKQDRDRLKKCRESAIVLQAAFRGYRVRQDVAKMCRAATVIQANFRMHKEQSAYRRQHWAASVLQQRFRAQRLRNSQLENYHQMRNAVINLQALYRGKQEKAAALLIQSAFRRHQARTWYNETQASAVTIQRWFRSCNVLRRQRDDYLAIREAAVKLQSAIRGTLARRLARRKRAAVKIQSVIRMSIQRRSYLTLRSSTVKLQSHCRAWVARRRFLMRRTAAATLQKHYRGRQVQRVQRSLYLKTLTSVKMLQARVRGHIQLKRYQNLKSSAVTIQVCTKAFYRGMVERRRFQHQRASAAIIQECFRAHLLCRRERAKYLEMKKSAVLIQVSNQSTTTTITPLDPTRFIFLLMANSDRGSVWMTQSPLPLQEQRAAVLVQSSFRGWVQKRAFQRQREAALVLQRRVRAMQQAKAERVKYTRLKQATITVQAHCRGWIARRQLREAASAERRVRFCAAVYHHFCAVRIQRALRSQWALRSAKRQITSVIFIQRWLRARIQRRRYLEDRRRVVVAQRAARSWLARRHRAASTIQHAARTFLLRRREQRVQQGIIKAQALWRGHQSRKLHDNRKVVSMRHRLRKVSEEVREEDRLCNKTSWAIEYLLKYKHFSYILEALKNLETATRLSPECCERLVTSGATLVIFTLIRSCNRSVPSMEVITYAIQVLLNLSKYDKTIEAVYAVENSVDTLLDLLQIYREKAGDKVADKGGSIFTKACFLLIILLQDQYRALEVRKLSKAVDRLRSIYRLTARKHKMDAERTVVKQKMGASINGSFIVPATPRKSKPVFSPDWVLRKDKLQDIVDPLRAVQMVADVFSIVL